MSERPYPDVPARPDYPAIERAVLDRWDRDGTFQASIEHRPAEVEGRNAEYVFYDGPPFANGLPHYGHLLTGYVKDVVPRYQTMRGKRVERRFGWDCHGLPAEMQVEKELGVAGRAAITDYGIDRFNEACRASVLHFRSEWERYVTRQARWVDFHDDYKTMDRDYMESVIWAFKQLWDAGHIYEAFRVMPYSWGAQTPLSNFEIRLDDAMRPRQDPALTVRFALVPEAGDAGAMEMWAWTTTPWTLPANLALTVGPNLEYDLVETGAAGGAAPRIVVIGSTRREVYARELGDDARVIATVRGSDLVGRRYEPIFPYFADRPDSFRVVADGYVGTDDGTGIVHTAPGHGEDDQRVGEANGIGLVSPVDDAGAFTSEVGDYAGVNVFEANPLIARRLRAEGRIIRHETYDHNYPHCWRTDTPIIYKAVSSWYVQVTGFRDRLVDLNQQINWIPTHVRDGQFGKWLEGARDWSISRNRFWGSPIPVWRSDDPAHPRIDVYGSLDELEADFGVRPDDLHRPWIDELVRPNPDDPSGRSMMRRDPAVFDCWFESGSMPFAQVHYPFENREWFDTHSPADFIVEYLPQTRGWFYTLHVLSGALFDRPAFENVICHGVLLDVEGRKLSKKLRNYAEPDEVMETRGSDALRWSLMSSPIVRGGDARVSADGSEVAEVVRQVLNPIWNTYAFFTTYANVDGYRAKFDTSSAHVLDRYILAKTASLRAAVTDAMDRYDIPGACYQTLAFLDALTNWYVRRSRDRFWAPARPGEADGSDKVAAYDTLYSVLTTLCRITAPLLPLISEHLYTRLTGAASVHLADWPDADELPADPALVDAMDRVRAVCSATLGLREERRLRARLPLRELVIAGDDAASLDPYLDLVSDEVNVKLVRTTTDASAFGTRILRPNAKVLGPRLGGAVQQVIAAAKAGEWAQADDGTVDCAGQTLTGDEYELALQTREGQATAAVRMLDPEGRTVDLGLVVSLDVSLDDALIAEGRARDVVRQIQSLRKERDLFVTDRISVSLHAPVELTDAVTEHWDHISAQTLAAALDISASSLPVAATVDGVAISLDIAKV